MSTSRSLRTVVTLGISLLVAAGTVAGAQVGHNLEAGKSTTEVTSVDTVAGKKITKGASLGAKKITRGASLG